MHRHARSRRRHIAIPHPPRHIHPIQQHNIAFQLRLERNARPLRQELVDRAADLRLGVCEVIREFWRRPSVEEARVWGGFPFEGAEMFSPTVKTLARSYRWSDVIHGVTSRSFLYGSFPDRSWNTWHEASMRLTPMLLRRTIRLVQETAAALRSTDPRVQKVMMTARWLRAKLR